MELSPWSLDMAYEDYNDFIEISPENIQQIVPNSNANVTLERRSEFTNPISEDQTVPQRKIPFRLPESNIGIGSIRASSPPRYL